MLFFSKWQLFFLTNELSRKPHGEETLRLSLPAPELELGTPPRLCYPLVIFLTRRDNRDPHPDETVSFYFITPGSLPRNRKTPLSSIHLISLFFSLLFFVFCFCFWILIKRHIQMCDLKFKIVERRVCKFSASLHSGRGLIKSQLIKCRWWATWIFIFFDTHLSRTKDR